MSWKLDQSEEDIMVGKEEAALCCSPPGPEEGRTGLGGLAACDRDDLGDRLVGRPELRAEVESLTCIIDRVKLAIF